MAIFGLIVMGILRTPPADRWAKWAYVIKAANTRQDLIEYRFAIPENAHNNRTAEGAHHPPALPQNDATVEANEDAIQNTGQEATPPTPPVSQVTPRNTPESTSPDTTSTGEPLPWANAACDA